MLEDRDYMRSDFRPRQPWNLAMSGSMWLIVSLVVAYVAQLIDTSNDPQIRWRALELTADGLRHGYVWQFLTFQFLHGSPLHLIFNLLGIWMFGKPVEDRLGKAHFFKLYFLSGVAGGVLQCALMWAFPQHFGGAAIGASAGVCGLIAAFSLMDPNAIILAYFVIPLRAIWLLYIETAYTLYNVLVPSQSGIAHGAHLGGIMFAAAYVKWGLNASQFLSDWNPLQRKIRSERMIKAATAPQFSKLLRPRAEDAAELPSKEFISQQVDPILDKISAHGIQSLTDREKQILQAARNKMSKR